jgi:hypothetical protein
VHAAIRTSVSASLLPMPVCALPPATRVLRIQVWMQQTCQACLCRAMEGRCQRDTTWAP